MSSDADRLDLLDYFSLLGVPPNCAEDDIRRAFREFARKYHPDRFVGAPPDKVERAAQIYRRGAEAHRILIDPQSRALYMKALTAGRRRLSSEDVARALQPQAAAPPKPQPVIRSSQALAFYNRSREAEADGDFRGAWKSLKAALELEPDSELLEQHLERVERRLRGR